MTEIAPDTVIDSRYKVLSRIGAGGMAEVFCAQDQSLGRKVALKLLYERFASDAEFVERSAVRRRARRASSTPTSSASTTAADGTAPTTSRWSTCRAAR